MPNLFLWLPALLVAVILGANIPDHYEVDTGATASLVELMESGDDGSSSAALDDPNAYFKVPNFVFAHMGVEELTLDRMECQRICNEKPQCRSYSYKEPTKEKKEEAAVEKDPRDDEAKAQNIKDAQNQPNDRGTCIWSVEGLHYSLGWVFFTKAKDVDWKGQPHLTTENFHRFNGLEYQEAGFKTQKNKSLQDCQDTCAKDPKCGAFSYHQENYECRLAGSGVHYDPHFSYYEKPTTHRASQSETDITRDAKVLSAQEKAAKSAASQSLSNRMKDRENQEKLTQKRVQQTRYKHERNFKLTQLHQAEETLLSLKGKEMKVKDDEKVQAAFETGYFQQRGMAVEKKTKEVHIKKLELDNQEAQNAKESDEKTGAARYQRLKQQKALKISEHEINIRSAQEKLLKLKNKQLAQSLKAQENSYNNLAAEERQAELDIQTKHEENIKALQASISKTKQQIKTQTDVLMQAKMDASAELEKMQAQKAAEVESHKQKLEALKRKTDDKVASILQGQVSP